MLFLRLFLLSHIFGCSGIFYTFFCESIVGIYNERFMVKKDFPCRLRKMVLLGFVGKWCQGCGACDIAWARAWAWGFCSPPTKKPWTWAWARLKPHGPREPEPILWEGGLQINRRAPHPYLVEVTPSLWSSKPNVQVTSTIIWAIIDDINRSFHVSLAFQLEPAWEIN